MRLLTLVAQRDKSFIWLIRFCREFRITGQVTLNSVVYE
jgi:hypothetical protein